MIIWKASKGVTVPHSPKPHYFGSQASTLWWVPERCRDRMNSLPGHQDQCAFSENQSVIQKQTTLMHKPHSHITSLLPLFYGYPLSSDLLSSISKLSEERSILKKNIQKSMENPSRVDKNCKVLTHQSTPDMTMVHTKARGLPCPQVSQTPPQSPLLPLSFPSC